METLVAILFGDTEPITEAFWVGAIHVRDDGIYLPAVEFLAFEWRVKDNSNSKEVVDAIHIAMLRLHLVVDAMDGFRTTFDSESKSVFFELLLEWRNERGDVSIALRFFLIERVRDILIGLVVGKL